MTAAVSHPVTSLKGAARVPGDKSVSHRSLIIGALAHGETRISGLLEGEDVLHTAQALAAMGVPLNPPANPGGVWTVTGAPHGFQTPKTAIYLGNSGTSARLLMGVMAGQNLSATITGDVSLSRRPMGRVIKPLSQMGARFDISTGDLLPLRISGSKSLRGISYAMPMASAQVKSAILLAGLAASGETTVIEKNRTRDHTERMLTAFGAEVLTEEAEGGTAVTLKPGARLQARAVTVPSDPSSAAFPVVAALITQDSDIVVPNVMTNPTRFGLYETLIEMGADISFENERESGGETVADIRARSSRLKGVTVPAARAASMIDEYPILSIAAACAEGKTRMLGLAELRVKESDRLAAIAAGLAANGVSCTIEGDDLTVEGANGAPQGGGTVEVKLDHRIAMSFLVLGMAAKQPVRIDDKEAIGTSFPGFADLMNGLGAAISAEETR